MGVLSTCMYVYHACATDLRRPKEGIRSPGTGVTDGSESLCGCWDQSFGPFEVRVSALNCYLSNLTEVLYLESSPQEAEEGGLWSWLHQQAFPFGDSVFRLGLPHWKTILWRQNSLKLWISLALWSHGFLKEGIELQCGICHGMVQEQIRKKPAVEDTISAHLSDGCYCQTEERVKSLWILLNLWWVSAI